MLLGSAEEQKELAKRIDAAVKASDDSVDMTRETLYSKMDSLGAETVQPFDVVALLMVLARQGGLLSSLVDDERYREAVQTHLEGMAAKDVLAAVQQEPNGREAVNVFLQIVLRGVAQLKDEDAARYGLRILNTLKKQGNSEYSDLVAFDLDQGKFVWTEPVQI